MRAIVIITFAILFLGCGFKKEAKPAEQDSASEVEEPARVERSESLGAGARTRSAQDELDKVREQSKQKRDKRVNEIFDQ